VGVDGVSKAEFGERLESNLEGLTARMKRLGYRPGPVRQVLIPKGEKAGAMRPLGISNFEDKLVQGVTRQVLESIYEPYLCASCDRCLIGGGGQAPLRG